jgi:ADP-ribosylglycohydrolase
MRGEVHGLIAPGNPELAAELAYRDAIISHVKEGVYGEVFNSVMVSLAFVTDDVGEIVNRALGYVPANSDFASVVRSTVAKCKEHGRWEDVLDWIDQAYGDLHWIHTFPNAAIVVMSLLLGGGDFSKSVSMAASCGWDCDCSTGQVGATVGALIGERAIPARWKEPIAGRLDTDVIGFSSIELDKLTDWTCNVARRLAQA